MSPLSTRCRAWLRCVAAGAPHRQQALQLHPPWAARPAPGEESSSDWSPRTPQRPRAPVGQAPPLLTTPTQGGEGRRAAVLTGSPMLLLAPGAPGEALSLWRQGPPCRATVLCPRPDASASPVSESPQKCNDLRGPRFSWSRGALSGRSWELEPCSSLCTR